MGKRMIRIWRLYQANTVREKQKLAEVLKVYQEALKIVRRFKPDFLVVSLGMDIMPGDPTGAFLLNTGDMREIGSQLSELHLPTLVVQEGSSPWQTCAGEPVASCWVSLNNKRRRGERFYNNSI